MLGGWQCATPIKLPDAGLDDVPKGASSGLGGGMNKVFCIVSY